jgi:hypothetical protein
MIEARGLVKRYGSTMAVNDLSFLRQFDDMWRQARREDGR